MSIEIEGIRFEVDYVTKEIIGLIIDFDNDRHHFVQMEKGFNRDHLVNNLRVLANHLENDKLLDD